MKKILLLFSLVTIFSFSSTLKGQNLLYVDERPLHFGFSLGMNMIDLTVNPSMLPCGPNGEVLQARVSSMLPGFSVGVIGDVRLNRYFNLRLHPTFHFGQRTISYKPEGADKKDPIAYQTDIVSMPITIPIYVKFNADREWNGRPYLLAGGGVSFDVGRDKERYVLTKFFDYFVEFGVGCELYFSFFKLSPELKFSIGLNNALVPVDQRPELRDETVQFYTNALSRLGTRMLTLSFNFE